MTGALLGVGEGRLSLDDIRFKLDHPKANHWRPGTPNLNIPPHGLYLKKVHYHEEGR